jgi:DNA polymerase III delta subunit
VKELGHYIENPSASSYLVLCFDKFDKRSSLVTLLTKAQIMFECQPLSEREVVDLMVQEAKACGLRLSRSAAQLMVGFLESDLLACRQALEKLRLSLGSGEVAEDDVLKHITEVGAPDAFALVRAIAEGNLKEALAGLMGMRNALESPLKFLGLLQWQMRILVSLKHYLDQGLPEFEAGRAAGIFGDRLGWMVKIARKKNMSFHTARLTRILAADSALKSVNSAYPYNFIEKVVYQCAVGM